MGAQSVEPNVADKINGELRSYKLNYKLEQESLNDEIDKALNEYASKSGGNGGNRPDVKLLLQDEELNFYPVLIEYKGYSDKLVKFDSDGNVENRTPKNEPNFKNIKDYAVNGAIHYANAILHHTSYTDVIAIGITGQKDERGVLKTQMGVYFVSKSNLGLGQKVGKFSDLSFLKASNFDKFAKTLKTLNLNRDELEKIKQKRENEITASLVKLNNDIYNNEKGLGENDRVYLVAASIIATLGVAGKVAPLEKSQLLSSSENGNTDGEILMRKIRAFLDHKHLPTDKKDLIIRTLSNTILAENINKITDGQTQLKRVFSKIVDDLGIYYKIGLTTDFTGKLFNEMYSWLGFSQDKLNDVVLTPSYVATLLCRLARVNKDSYVWDFATGSAGLLVAAMNEMIKDAKATINSPELLKQKELKIKAEQLLGLEILPSVYMLAVLNMIMMGDGSSNILNKDSIQDFNGNYGFGDTNTNFPATAFVLNPPYSAQGNGMIFVKKAFEMMHSGYAAIIIQNSAGSGKAKDINKEILKHNTLIASIKMPSDLFIGKSSVQTNIYVFKIGERHEKDEQVKFIDFSNDGYARSNRKKASNNLKIADRAHERYDELVNLVRFGKSKLEIFSENEYYESTIDPDNGADWNKSRPVDTMPTLSDFKKSVSDYLSWEVAQILKKDSPSKSSIVNQRIANLEQEFKTSGGKFKEFRLDEIFEISGSKTTPKLKLEEIGLGKFPYVTTQATSNGIAGFYNFWTEKGNCITIDSAVLGTAFYQKENFSASDHVEILRPKFKINEKVALYFATLLNRMARVLDYSYGKKRSQKALKNEKILLPTLGGEINFSFMEKFIEELDAYLRATGLKNYELTQSEKSALVKFDEFSRRGGVAREFKIGDLFEKLPAPYVGKGNKFEAVSKERTDEYCIPVVYAKFGDNGIMYWAKQGDFITHKNVLSVIYNGAIAAGLVYAQPYETGILAESYFVKLKDIEVSFRTNLFLQKVLEHFLYPKYSREYLATWSGKVENEKIILPTNDSGEIDYEFMENFIKAIEKLVIKEVVLWADAKINATKSVIKCN